MKKLFSLSIVVFAAVLLVGCGSSESADETVKVDASKPSKMGLDQSQGGGTQKAAPPTGADQ